MYTPNFLPQKNNVRLLQTGIFAVLVACGVLTGLLLRGTGSQTAMITDNLSTPSPSSVLLQQNVIPRAISENAVAGVALGVTGDTVRYYEKETGKAFSVNLPTQQVQVLSEQRLPAFLYSYWIPKNEQVISEFQVAKGSRYTFFDYKTKESSPIGSETTSIIAISPSGASVAYVDVQGDASIVYVSAIDGSSPRKILETRAENIQLEWPIEDALLMRSQQSGRVGKDLTAIGLDGTLATILSGKENLEYRVSPDASALLLSYFDQGTGIILRYHSLVSGAELLFDLQTSANKCAWHSDGTRITCGVPYRSALTRDVPAGNSATIDNVATIDLNVGDKTINYTADGTTLLGVIDPIMSPSGRYFVFTNIFDQRLYLLPL